MPLVPRSTRAVQCAPHGRVQCARGEGDRGGSERQCIFFFRLGVQTPRQLRSRNNKDIDIVDPLCVLRSC
jgi:hypothetical protein